MEKKIEHFTLQKFEYHDKPRVLFVTEENDTTFGGFLIEEQDYGFFKRVFNQMISESEVESEREMAKDIFENSIKSLYEFKKFSKNKVTKWL